MLNRKPVTESTNEGWLDGATTEAYKNAASGRASTTPSSGVRVTVLGHHAEPVGAEVLVVDVHHRVGAGLAGVADQCIGEATDGGERIAAVGLRAAGVGERAAEGVEQARHRGGAHRRVAVCDDEGGVGVDGPQLGERQRVLGRLELPPARAT